jgi:hypothetical protein
MTRQKPDNPGSVDHSVAKSDTRLDLDVPKLEWTVAAADMPTESQDLQGFAALLKLADLQKLLAIQLRGKVELKYADLFRRMKLSPADLDRLKVLLGDRQSAYADAIFAATEQGLTGQAARDLAARVNRDEQKQIDASIKSLLGPDRFNQLQAYERTAPQRETAQQLSTRLGYTTEPLTSRQREQLVQLLAKPASTSMPAMSQVVPALPSAIAAVGVGSSSTLAISDAAIGAARNFLTPVQVAELQKMKGERDAQLAIGQLLRAQAAPVTAVTARRP